MHTPSDRPESLNPECLKSKLRIEVLIKEPCGDPWIRTSPGMLDLEHATFIELCQGSKIADTPECVYFFNKEPTDKPYTVYIDNFDGSDCPRVSKSKRICWVPKNFPQRKISIVPQTLLNYTELQ